MFIILNLVRILSTWSNIFMRCRDISKSFSVILKVDLVQQLF